MEGWREKALRYLSSVCSAGSLDLMRGRSFSGSDRGAALNTGILNRN